MSDNSDKKHIFDDPKNVQRLLNGFYGVCILLVIADFIIHRHISLDWERIPAYYAIYGFVACVVLVLLAKVMRKGLMRGANYYDE